MLDKDMLVLIDEDTLFPGGNWDETISEAVNEASKNGFVIVLITEDSANSYAIKHEIQTALNCGGKIVPVYVGKATLTEDLLDQIGDIQGVHISEDPSDEELDQIVEHILQRVEFYHNDFRVSHSI